MTDESTTNDRLGELEAIGQELQKRPKEEMFAGRTTASDRLESWDNDHFRERVREILLTAKVMDIDIGKIQVPAQGLAKFQFRRNRAPSSLKESIKANGVLEPILLQQVGESFFIVDGHGRLTAWQQAVAEVSDLPKPVFLVIDSDLLPDTMAMQLAAELNMNSQNFNDEDAAVLIIRLFEEGKMKQADIMRLLRKSKSYISEVISGFRDVPPEARGLIESGAWTVKHGCELARLKDEPDEQLRLMKQAIATKYSADLMGEKVDSVLAKWRWQKLAKGKLEAAPPETKKAGEAVGTLTTHQVEKIHSDIVKETTETKPMYSGIDKHVVKTGKGEYEPTIAATTKILKSQGYEIVEGPEPKTVEKKELPKMPEDDALMEESHWTPGICPVCKGRTHPAVAKALGFDTDVLYRRSGTQANGIAHKMCAILNSIKELKDELKKDEQYLQKDDLYRLLQAGKTTLEEINNKSHALYKDELERRKQAWREKNLPKTVLKTETAIQKPAVEKKNTLFARIDQLETQQPDLVPSDHDYWGAYRKYKAGENGWEDHRSVAKSMGLSSHGSVQRQFQKIESALAELQ
jgi:ParB-like chromosome segregation protein Spo0J